MKCFCARLDELQPAFFAHSGPDNPSFLDAATMNCIFSKARRLVHRLAFLQDGAGMRVTALQDSSGALKGRFAGRVRKPVSLAAIDQTIAQQASAWWC